MKQIKKPCSLILVILMLCTGMVFAQAGTNGHSQSEAVAWAESQNGKAIDTDGFPAEQPYQCVDLLKAYYSYLGASAYTGGNANAYQTRSIPDGWSRIPYSSGITFQPGDIAVWKTNLSPQGGYSTTSTGNLGHVGIILSADNVGFNAAEQNAGNKPYVTINWHYNSELYCVIRPDFVSHNPFGVVDKISGGSGCIYIKGWTMDNDDLTRSLDIHVYIGGSSATPSAMAVAIKANKSRKDVDAVYHCGEFHGFDATIQTTLTGSQPVYIYAINIGTGENIELGHQTVTINKHNHLYTSTVTKTATCSTTGERTYTCVCGASYTEPISKDSSNHVRTTNVAATNSTCTVKGYTEGVYCNDCKQYVSGHAAKPLADHTITIINKKDATYDAEGYTGDEYCTVCKQTIKTGTAIPKLEKTDEPTQPDTPDDNYCKWCGRKHTGALAFLIIFFHAILGTIFGARY